jgi:uncharacterized protein YjbI with pentapeptide repeats
MANPEHLAKLKQGVEAWNQWRNENTKIEPDLEGAALGAGHLRGIYFRKASLDAAILIDTNLTRADLSGATARRAHLEGATLAYSDLMNANLSSANLNGVNLFGANLFGANLTWANLTGANLTGATLDNSDMTRAYIGGTSFGDNNRHDVGGLETVHHFGPSTIGTNTIYRSKGKIPEVFLRGCGVPDEFITFAKSIVTSPIQFYSCFISYSTKDQAFADRLYADLQNKGVRCWFAPHDVQGGKKIHEQIDEAIRLHDKLLLILSPHSMESEWVKTEIAKARKRELRDQRRVLFPIRLAPFETLRDWECFDADTGKDSAREIREYFIPDFSHWKNHDSYQEAFQSLIRDLKASDAKPK